MKNYFLIATILLPFWNALPFLNQKIAPSMVVLETTINENNKELLEQLAQEWLLMKGGLKEERVEFHKKDETIHKDGLFSTYRFDKDQSIHFELFNPQKHMMCGVGLMHLEKGQWTLESDNQLKLTLEGGYFAMSKFEHEIIYKIEKIDAQILQLRVVKRLKNEVKDPD